MPLVYYWKKKNWFNEQSWPSWMERVNLADFLSANFTSTYLFPYGEYTAVHKPSWKPCHSPASHWHKPIEAFLQTNCFSFPNTKVAYTYTYIIKSWLTDESKPLFSSGTSQELIEKHSFWHVFDLHSFQDVTLALQIDALAHKIVPQQVREQRKPLDFPG